MIKLLTVNICFRLYTIQMDDSIAIDTEDDNQKSQRSENIDDLCRQPESFRKHLRCHRDASENLLEHEFVFWQKGDKANERN